MMTTEEAAELRAEFLRALTEDSATKGAGRKTHKAIFDAERGYAIWSSTDLKMVMDKFDQAVKEML